MECVPVDFDDEAFSAPEKVDLTSGDADIRRRQWQTGFPYEGEQAFLGLGACAGEGRRACDQRVEASHARLSRVTSHESIEILVADEIERECLGDRALEGARV